MGLSSKRAVFVGVVVLFMQLTGCGQKGPLILPQPEQPSEQSPEKISSDVLGDTK